MDIKKKNIETYNDVALYCQRCEGRIQSNKYVSPYDVYKIKQDENAVFNDGTYMVHLKCLTPDELKHLKDREDL